MSPFLRFFKGEVKKNGRYVSIAKSIPKPVIDSRVKKAFTKDIPKFLNDEIKPVAISLAKNVQNGLLLPQKMSDLFNNILTNLNTPVLLPMLVVTAGIVGVVIISRK